MAPLIILSSIQHRTSIVLLGTLLGLFLTLPGVEAGAQAKRGRVVIEGRVVVSVELARSWEEHVKGLSGRSGLKKGEGMLFLFDGKGPRSIWMKGMRFPLDILWIVDGRIAAIERQVPPPSPDRPLQIYTHEAEMILEVQAGFVDQHGIQIGSQVKFLP